MRGATTNNGNVFLRGGSTFENYIDGTGSLTITGNNSKFQYFDNTETDLDSDNVESVIKEINLKKLNNNFGIEQNGKLLSVGEFGEVVSDVGLSALEVNSNKTTLLSEDSTDIQYPTAKAVFDALATVGGEIIMELGEGF